MTNENEKEEKTDADEAMDEGQPGAPRVTQAEAAPEAGRACAPAEAPPAKPSFEELEAMLAKAEADAAGYFAQLQRTTADFDNYRKRMLREREELAKAASERIIQDIIEPVENLDRALESAKSAKSVRKLRDGVALTRAQIWGALERHGLRRIETAGTMFDPRWHEAVEQALDDSSDEGMIKGEICSGYVLNGKVLRCAKVKVSKKSAGEK